MARDAENDHSTPVETGTVIEVLPYIESSPLFDQRVGG
jgi:hypothetical protein